MKALVLQQKQQLYLMEDFPDPIPKKKEVVIKVRYCGICGSDLEAYQYGMVLTPIILGHEFTGEIIQIGANVEGWQIGDRVTTFPGAYCGKCFYCKNGQENLCHKITMGLGLTVNGALAEYVKVPAYLLQKLPETVRFDEGALVEPLSVGFHGVTLSKIAPTDTALVIGAGTIGLATLLALRYFKVKDIYVIEPSEYNRALALEIGAKETNHPRKINRIGPDFIFDCAGFPETYISALSIIRKGGTIIILGIHFEPVPISFLLFSTKEVKMKGSFGYSLQEFQEVLSLIATKKLEPRRMISKKIKLEEAIDKGFDELLKPERKAAKILVEL
ncbi:MAG: alcohol dehydrogenase catalytic domain-containing protein [Candidatus Helarchaeota archaeon]